MGGYLSAHLKRYAKLNDGFVNIRFNFPLAQVKNIFPINQ